jgi:hypothetical protein
MPPNKNGNIGAMKQVSIFALLGGFSLNPGSLISLSRNCSPQLGQDIIGHPSGTVISLVIVE